MPRPSAFLAEARRSDPSARHQFVVTRRGSPCQRCARGEKKKEKNEKPEEGQTERWEENP